jgi:putative cell wall-binding protein
MTHRKPSVRLVVATTVCGAVVVAAATLPAGASGITETRIAGADRYGTAVAIAQTFTPPVPEVILADGLDFPDALTAGYLAGRLHAPILLTPTDPLSAETASELQTLGVKGVDIVGGTDAVSADVQNTLTSDGYTVQRIAGADRYGTAEAVAEQVPDTLIGSFPGGGPTAIVASGVNFPDALAGSALAFSASYPMLLTDPGTLSTETASALTTLGIKQVILLGGTNAVSAGVQTAIAGMGITVTRVGGADRTDTAGMLADMEISALGWSTSQVDLARGDLFPDALSGGTLAGTQKAPVVFTEDPDDLGPYTTAWLQAHASTLTSMDVLGGTSAIADSTVATAQADG